MNSKIKILTKIGILSYLIICAFGILHAQENTISVSGHVIDETTGNPVIDHLVMVTLTDSIIYQEYEFYTNNEGLYGNDSIPSPDQGFVIASTIDCIGVEHIQEASFNPVNNSFVFDFLICNDSIPQSDCENWFWHETFDGLTFNFFGESIPFPADDYFWEFGDGNTASGPMVTHIYNLNDFVSVTLTTISFDSISGDSCIATSAQEIWVGNIGDCQADFDYSIDSTPTGVYLVQFIDLSIGQPTYWHWDFGDGTSSEEQNPEHMYYFPDSYIVCLTISGDSTNCYDEYCEEVIIGGNSDCENWFWYETNDNTTFNFYGESLPVPADEWHWDFGDGNVADEQIVTHTFEPNQSDWFNISLFTETYDPLSGDSCYAISSQWLWVGDTLNCHADFYYIQDSMDQMAVNFFDASSGLITSRLWDFGDGSFSEEINPFHIFPGPGTFTVCLSVLSDSLGFYCSDMFCLEVVIEYAINSNFTIALDTLSGMANNYFFTDISSGNPNLWFWDFGDGNTSISQNATHQYTESGTYEVCLEATRSFPGFGVYSNTYCQTIVTPNYFDFGGQVFLDGFPLNNFSGDTSIIDTGMAFLYRKYDNNLIPVDTNIFYSYGYYWFSQIREGDYIVKVGLTENSLNFNNYSSSYYQNKLHWEEANILHLFDTNYYVNVDLIELFGIGQGPGSISGFITNSTKNFLNPLLFSEIEILLFDSNGNPLTFTLTDESGNFAFENIPLGSYKLYAEATGLISFAVSVSLDENNQTVNNINLELFEQTVNTEEYLESVTVVGDVFPNPVKDQFNVKIELDDKTELMIDIFSMNGQKVNQQKIRLNKGSHKLLFNGSILPHGVYMLSIISEDRKIIETRKFIK